VENSACPDSVRLRGGISDLRGPDRLALLAIRESSSRRRSFRRDVGRRRPHPRILHLWHAASRDFRPRARDLLARNGLHELLQNHARTQRDSSGVDRADGDPRHRPRQLSSRMGLHVPRLRLPDGARGTRDEPRLRPLPASQTHDELRFADRGRDASVHVPDALPSGPPFSGMIELPRSQNAAFRA